MKKLLALLALAGPMLFAQLQSIADTITTPQGGTFGGTITVTLNNPATAQPLYYGSTTLSGWQQTYTITSGAFSATLYANSTITPTGTSYTARYTPSSGSAWSETWVVPVGATTIREIRSTTVPTPSVLFSLAQIRQGGATLGQGLVWNGSAWAPSAVVADPMTTTGDIITRSGGVPTRLGLGSTGQVLTVAGGLPSWAAPATSGTVTSVSVTTANGVSGTVATATSTPAISLTLGAITPTSVAASGAVTGSNLSGTNTGDQTTITGNAGTATALAANGANCAAGTFPLGVDASGAAESCTALPTTIAGTANQITASGATGAVTLSLPAAVSGLTSVAATTFTGALTGNASTATTLQTARTIAGVSFNGSANIAIPSTGLSDTADIVRGASSVAAGQVLYGVSAGVAGSESAFTYGGAGGAAKTITVTGSTSSKVTTVSGTRSLEMSSIAADQNYLVSLGLPLSVGTTTNAVLMFLQNNTERARFAATTGNLLIGTTTDSNFNLDVATSGSSGTIRAYDQTATTGVTQLIVRAGAGQAATNLQTWQNAAGTVLAGVESDGDFNGVNLLLSGTVFLGGGADGSFLSSGVNFKSTGVFAFSSTTNATATKDLSLSRASANVLQVGDGGSNSNGIVLASLFRSPLTTPASASATGVTGTIEWDANYIYIATGTNTWKRVAIATW